MIYYILVITADFITEHPLISHHTRSGHGGMMAVENTADGTIAYRCFTDTFISIVPLLFLHIYRRVPDVRHETVSAVARRG